MERLLNPTLDIETHRFVVGQISILDLILKLGGRNNE